MSFYPFLLQYISDRENYSYFISKDVEANVPG
jgi:hypothetical protein